jgi:hypothetical protein
VSGKIRIRKAVLPVKQFRDRDFETGKFGAVIPGSTVSIPVMLKAEEAFLADGGR